MRTVGTRLLLASLVVLLLGVVSCGDEAKFAVAYAPGFAKEGARVSVLGVFRDGRMNPEAWDDLAPRFVPALHRNGCEIAVGNGLRVLTPSVFNAIDSVAREEGITDDLVGMIAPAATGDSVLVITVAGHPPSRDAGVPDGIDVGGAAARGGRGRPAAQQQAVRPGRAGPGQGQGPDTNVFEMSATLFSVQQKKSVARVSMTYTGHSEDEAIDKFVQKLALSLPNATCAGWKPDLGLDPVAVEKLK